MNKMIFEKISLLKKGDSVVIYSNDKRWSAQYYGEERVISSVGKDNIYVKDEYEHRYKFDKNGYGDYGTYLFPGTKDELSEYRKFLDYKSSVWKRLETEYSYLTKEQIDKIVEILNK
jgi:hypothetical protein